MADWLEWALAVLCLVIGASGILFSGYAHHTGGRKRALAAATSDAGLPAPPTPRRTTAQQAAFRAGRADVMEGWISWAKSPTRTERDAEQTLARSRYGRHYQSMHASSVYAATSEGKLNEILGHHVTTQWDTTELMAYLSDLRICRDVYAKNPEEKRTAILRMQYVAALITDRREETYDPAAAPVTAEHAYHEDHNVQASYLEGRGKGTEDVMDAITAVRTRSREIGAAGNALAAANARHAAALAALRETNQPTASRDAHRDYDEQMRALEAPEPTDPTE